MKFTLATSTAIDKNALRAQAVNLAPYFDTLKAVIEAGDYSAPEASLNLPSDDDMLTHVEELVTETRTPDLRYIFVIGIGGSNLGTKAIYDALYSARDITPHTEARLIFVDTNDTELLTACRDSIWSCTKPTECLLVSISKSGGTSETLANTEILLGVIREKWGSEVSRLVVIADANSPYIVAARGKGISTLTLPMLVGGRFSVLSAVGLFPLALLGLPIGDLHAGARDMRQFCLNKDTLLNPAAESALVLATQYAQGKTIHDMFVFGSGLESLGKWYRQLLGESIGKETGAGVAVGITPTVSVGSTDLHSVGQLYLGGPNTRVTTFVSVRSQTQSPTVSTTGRVFPELAPMITGKTTTDIMTAILGGTTHAYNGRGLPFMEIELEGHTLRELGAFMQMKMIEVMCLAYLLKVNAFNQPAVELYKVETKRILEGGLNEPL